MSRTMITLSLVLSSAYANEQHCDRYYTMANGTCVIRHHYVRYLARLSIITWLVNFGTKCQHENWYIHFFFYNLIIPIIVASETTRMGGGSISDIEFYIMVGFQSVGTLVLFTNLLILSVTWIRSFTR